MIRNLPINRLFTGKMPVPQRCGIGCRYHRGFGVGCRLDSIVEHLMRQHFWYRIHVVLIVCLICGGCSRSDDSAAGKASCEC